MTKRTCSVPECARTSRTRGYCQMHYQRVLKHGQAEPPKRAAASCSVAGCPRPHLSRGYCSAHWQRWRKTGDPGPAIVRPPRAERAPVCTVEGCERPHAALAYCSLHAHRFRTTGSPGGLELNYPTRGECSVDGCKRPHSASGYCATHYTYLSKGKDPQAFTPIRERIDPLARDAKGRKQCTRCRSWKGIDAYGSRSREKDGLHVTCLRCQRSDMLQRLYLMTIDQYEAMATAQDGVCAICGKANANGKALFVDHDHRCCPGTPTCGTCTRQLLCGPCNHGIGYLQDDPGLLRAATAYLERHRE